jgi:hypothetical protein
MSIAGCSGLGKKAEVPVDPNAFPVNYRRQVLDMLSTHLTDPSAFRNALIAPPVLKPVPGGQTQHYVVCLQFNGHIEHKTKVVLFLDGVPDEFIDAAPQECADAAYQPFSELQTVTPEQ